MKSCRPYTRQACMILAFLVFSIGPTVTPATSFALEPDLFAIEQQYQTQQARLDSSTEPAQQSIPLKDQPGTSKLPDSKAKQTVGDWSTGKNILFAEGAILLYSSVSLIENGSRFLGWTLIVTSPLAMNGQRETTMSEEPPVVFASFITVGTYNLYMDRKDIPKKEMFRNNLIAMNLAVLSMAAAHTYGHPYKTSSDKETVGFNLLANADGVYGMFNYKW